MAGGLFVHPQFVDRVFFGDFSWRICRISCVNTWLLQTEIPEELLELTDLETQKYNTYPYLVLDTYYGYIREHSQVEEELLVKGISEDGYQGILGVTMAATEEEATWRGYSCTFWHVARMPERCVV